MSNRSVSTCSSNAFSPAAPEDPPAAPLATVSASRSDRGEAAGCKGQPTDGVDPEVASSSAFLGANAFSAQGALGCTSSPKVVPPPSPDEGPSALPFNARPSSTGWHAEKTFFKRQLTDGVLEMNSASASVSADDLSLQIAAARLNLATKDRGLSGSFEGGTAKLSSGVINPDGSRGRYVAAGATLVGGEVTGTLGGSSLTLGLSVGVGIELGSGVRDIDKDNIPEYCGRVSAGPLTVGACIERPF